MLLVNPPPSIAHEPLNIPQRLMLLSSIPIQEAKFGKIIRLTNNFQNILIAKNLTVLYGQ